MKGIIYKITNDVNDKVYIGKTFSSIEKRFKQHVSDSKKDRCEKRPLYNAMNKYGVDKFHIEEIGKFENLEEMEIKYIKEYNSYNSGYNATLGGDSRRYVELLDTDVIAKYNEVKNVRITAEFFDHCADTIRTILRNNNIEIVRHFDTPKIFCNELCIEFDNVSSATEYFMKNKLSTASNRDSVRRGILRAVDKTRKSYCGYTFDKSV